MLENFVPPYESTVTGRFGRKRALFFIGKTNLDEFAMGGSTENSAFQTTCNPWDITRVPGGSSGGSAAAVAGGQSPVSLGSDTGGSIRQPASFLWHCRNETYLRLGVALWPSGVCLVVRPNWAVWGRTVEDTAILLEAIAGHDPKDATSLKVKIPNYTQFLKKKIPKQPLKGRTIGIIKETFGEGLDTQVGDAVKRRHRTAQILRSSCQNNLLL